MIGKILKATQGRPCSCPVGKQCSKCQPKKAERVKPRIYIEDSRPLPVPVKVTTYKETPAKSFLLPYQKYNAPYNIPQWPVRSYQKIKSWHKFRKPSLIKSANRQSSISQWYKKRKAESDLKKLTKLEQRESARIEKAQRRREEEFIKQLNARQRKEEKQSKPELEAWRRREAEFIKKLNAIERKKQKEESKNQLDEWRRTKAEIIRQLRVKQRKEDKELKVPSEECPLYPGGEPCCITPKEPKVKKAKRVKGTEVKLCCKSEVVCSHAKKVSRPHCCIHTSSAPDQHSLASSTRRQPGTNCPRTRNGTLIKVKVDPKQSSRRGRSFGDKLTICCWRLCCQFYCCITFVLLVGLVVVFFS